MWRSENQLQELVPLFPPCEFPGDPTQIVRLSGKILHALHHLRGLPNIVFGLRHIYRLTE